ncbi:MAG: hypothetical protein ABIW82_15760 [Dokdonella sp.]
MALLESYERQARSTGAHVLMLPTTSPILAAVERLGLRPKVDAVVGRRSRQSTMVPADLLAHLADNRLMSDARIIVFTDQLVSPVDAPLLVSRNGRTQYVSALEYVLNAEYQCPLFAMNGRQLDYLPGNSPADRVLNFIVDHLDANELLGEAWLARSLQIQRQPQERRFQQRRRVRAMRSSIMHMVGPSRHHWDTSHEDKLRVLDDLYRGR